jgi:hypothetical protein
MDRKWSEPRIVALASAEEALRPKPKPGSEHPDQSAPRLHGPS